MLKRRIRNLALTATAFMSATVFITLGATGASAATGSEIVNWNYSPTGQQLCLGISGNDANADAIQWPCATDGQSWFTGGEISPGYYQIYWVKNGVKQCLGVAGGSTASGAQVVGWSCLGTGHPDQYWNIEDGFNGGCPGFNYIVNYASGKVLGVSANSTATGAPIVIWGNQGVCNNQQWLTGSLT